jgi:DNA modification methylase
MSNFVEFITEDAKNLSVKSNSVDLIITQIPFYKLDFLNYGGDPTKQIGSEKNTKKYINSLLQSIKEMERVLKPTGSIFIVSPSMDKMYFELPLKVLKKTDLILANSPLIWNWSDPKEQSQLGSIKFNYDLVFHFVKSPSLLYSNPYAIRKHSESVWNLPWNSSLNDVIKRLETIGYVENSFTPEIPKRLIEMFSKPNDIVLDPFGGSGTTVCEAYSLKRNGISIDVSEQQTDLAKIRLGFMKEKK